MSLNAFSVGELAEVSRRADNPELFDGLPSMDVDTAEVIAALDQFAQYLGDLAVEQVRGVEGLVAEAVSRLAGMQQGGDDRRGVDDDQRVARDSSA